VPPVNNDAALGKGQHGKEEAPHSKTHVERRGRHGEDIRRDAQTAGPELTIRVEREADIMLRDGLERGLGNDAMEFLHWQVTAWSALALYVPMTRPECPFSLDAPRKCVLSASRDARMPF
jgi:hypothetical protein